MTWTGASDRVSQQRRRQRRKLTARKGRDNVSRIRRHDFKHVSVIDNLANDILHIVRRVGIVGHQATHRRGQAIGRVTGILVPRVAGIVAVAVAGQKVQEPSHGPQRRHVVGKGIVRDTRHGSVRFGASQILLGHRLVGYRFDDFRT